MRNEKNVLTKNQILSELIRSPHGKLAEYLPVGTVAAKEESEFFGHLIAWNAKNGQIRDSQVALPVIALTAPELEEELCENALAHLVRMNPRQLLAAYRFALQVRPKGNMMAIKRVITNYLQDVEKPQRFHYVALQHRNTLKELYALVHLKPSPLAKNVLFEGIYPAGSVFEAVNLLKTMQPTEAAATIIKYRLPYLIVGGALGKKASDPNILRALIERMTPTELVTNTPMLEKMGMNLDPALRGAFDKALEKASKSKKTTFKATAKVSSHPCREHKKVDCPECSIQDEGLKQKLRGLQERQIQTLGGVDGNWLVIGDKSGSMNQAIEVSRHVAATLAKMVKGNVWLVYVDNSPQALDVTGLALDEILAKTRLIKANGGTSLGCGLAYMLENKFEIDGVAIVSDGGENGSPMFAQTYQKYSKMVDKEVPVYLYQCAGDPPHLIANMKQAGIDLQVFDLRSGVDYYSLPNLVATMNTRRYSFVDKIMAAPLLTLKKVKKEEEVLDYVDAV